MFVIPTRQKTGLLFPVRPPKTPGPFPVLLAAGASVVYGSFAVDGYATIAILAVSDQPFTIVITEGVIPAGPFVQTQSFSSTLVGSLQVVKQRFAPSGLFGKATMTNIGAAIQTQVTLLGQGIPLP
jgi:hypothetical protein